MQSADRFIELISDIVNTFADTVLRVFDWRDTYCVPSDQKPETKVLKKAIGVCAVREKHHDPEN